MTHTFRRLTLAALLGLIATTSPLIGSRAAIAETETAAETQTEAMEAIDSSATIDSEELADTETVVESEPGREVRDVDDLAELEVVPFGQDLPTDVDEPDTLDIPNIPETPNPPAPVVDPVPPVDPTPAPTFQRKVETRIQLDLSDRRLTLYADDEPVGSYTVAVGKPGWETPTGNYSVMHMAIDPIWENPWTGELIYPGPTNPMGRAVIVFHTIGDDMIAFHGTPDEGLLGQAVSHGCVRMRNEDILAMYDIVRRGTRVSVVP
jgi:lipoprotein-anchoring transpeptidase ErfK/SrfK